MCVIHTTKKRQGKEKGDNMTRGRERHWKENLATEPKPVYVNINLG